MGDDIARREAGDDPTRSVVSVFKVFQCAKTQKGFSEQKDRLVCECCCVCVSVNVEGV